MTRKRFVKLLMSRGFEPRYARAIASNVSKEKGRSYQESWDRIKSAATLWWYQKKITHGLDCAARATANLGVAFVNLSKGLKHNDAEEV